MDIAQLVQDVLDGNESGLTALAVLREEKKLIDNCIKQVEEIALEEAGRYTEKTFQHQDLFIEKRSGGRVYDFKHIEEWNVYKENLKNCEERYKQAYLASEKGLNIATNDGELLDLPKVIYRKDSLIIKRAQ